MDRIIGVIPARMNSSRFPGKPLAALGGRPMIEHVVRRAGLYRQFAAVYVATCDEEIKNAVEAFGGKVIMTSNRHARASDRVAEAAGHFEADIIVMIQGDEPMITPEMISAAVAALRADQSVDCVNLVRRIEKREVYVDFNTIKVVKDLQNNAVYFSRAPIPPADFSVAVRPPVYKQVCVIPFRRRCLLEFAALAPTPLEEAESVDMLRLIEHGRRIRLVETDADTHAVDTPADLRRVAALMRDDPLCRLYENPDGSGQTTV